MKNNSIIESKLEKAMTSQFSSAKDAKAAIHMTAASAAAICAILPIGVDVWALRTAEVIMVMCIASLFGEKLTKATAKGIFASSFAQLVGESAALAALAAASAANLLNPVVAYGIKTGIAVTLIEAVGHAALAYYKKKYEYPEVKSTTVFDIMCGTGAAADAGRILNAAGTAVASVAAENMTEQTLSESMAFTGRGEGRSRGWSESYWKELYVEAKANGDQAGVRHAKEGLKEAVENRIKQEMEKEIKRRC